MLAKLGATCDYASVGDAMTDEDCCGNCRWFREYENAAGNGSGTGDCMVRPPVVFVLEERGPITQRPQTCDYEWCSEWAGPREEAAE